MKKKKLLAVSIDEMLLNEFNVIANNMSLNKSNVIQKLLYDYVKKINGNA